VLTTDGRQLTGILAAETATSITLQRADNATDTVLRIDIEQLRSTGLSLMPEGLEKQIDPQAMADLIAYLMHAE
jgi:putative heme-binding domain-containing protein